MKTLTEREKAAILYQIATGASWTDIYAIAYNGKEEDARSAKSPASTASKWKNSAKVMQFYTEQKTLIEARRKEDAEKAAQEMMKGRERTTEESERTNSNQEGEKAAKVDYNNPENRIKLYNNIIARSDNDPKTQLDAAKVLEQIQKDDRTAAKEQRQTRFYLPQTCDSCPFYAKKAGKK